MYIWRSGQELFLNLIDQICEYIKLGEYQKEKGTKIHWLTGSFLFSKVFKKQFASLDIKERNTEEYKIVTHTTCTDETDSNETINYQGKILCMCQQHTPKELKGTHYGSYEGLLYQ